VPSHPQIVVMSGSGEVPAGTLVPPLCADRVGTDHREETYSDGAWIDWSDEDEVQTEFFSFVLPRSKDRTTWDELESLSTGATSASCPSTPEVPQTARSLVSRGEQAQLTEEKSVHVGLRSAQLEASQTRCTEAELYTPVRRTLQVRSAPVAVSPGPPRSPPRPPVVGRSSGISISRRSAFDTPSVRATFAGRSFSPALMETSQAKTDGCSRSDRGRLSSSTQRLVHRPREISRQSSRQGPRQSAPRSTRDVFLPISLSSRGASSRVSLIAQTWRFNGSGRLPDLGTNPVQFRPTRAARREDPMVVFCPRSV